MTDELFFDTDCLSAFLWTKTEYLLNMLYPGRIVIPAQVYLELSKPNIPHLKARIDAMLKNGEARLYAFETESSEEEMFLNLAVYSFKGRCTIGEGEAAAISFTKYRNGILASNNLKDVSYYIELFKLKSTTTALILFDAYQRDIINESDANLIWTQMVGRRRMLPYPTFTEYLKNRTK